MTGLKLDTYSTYARAFPVYITIIPIVLFLFFILPEGFNWKFGSISAIVFLPLSYLCKQVGGDFGKRRECTLWRKWGGPPTTRFLRHCNNEFNSHTRNVAKCLFRQVPALSDGADRCLVCFDRIHSKFRCLGLYVPSQEEQDQNPQEADNTYESCVDELRRRTRDSKRFPRVFQELRDYGFRRNIFALKVNL